MHSNWFGRIGLTALVVGAIGSSTGAVGCAAERDPINRVQANAIPKSFFIGEKFDDTSDDPEFYARTMVIDVPYGESGADWGLFTNTINVVAKIKWSIEENNLLGRVSFERIPGTDGKGLPPKKDPERDPSKPLAQNDGVVVYNFRIISHFDIRRSYNPQTGEELNVIEENTSDRIWKDREYIRVDFSQNLVTTAYDFDTMSLLGLYGGVKYSPMAFDVRNPNDENAPVYDIKNGYFDVTNKVFAEPQMIHFGSGFSFPACMLPNLIRGGSEPAGNCNPNEITLRHSFKRVTNTDYEPIHWDGYRFETYGAFTTDRNGYARDYGLADAHWKRYISRYNIWERSHIYQNPEKMEGATVCKVDADCSGVGGVTGISKCDTYNEKCTLPFQSRKEKPIVWHYSDGSAPEYFEATREATEEWDTAMRAAVQSAKYAECVRWGNLTADGEDCAETYPGVLTGNFAEEEDAIFLVKEVNACRREKVRAGATHDAAIEQCHGLADELSDIRGYSPAVNAIAKMKPMVILCHSPVDELDPPECGKPGTVARLGDLRFHLVTAVATPQTGSPWGIMSDANDPLTGEHIAASINVWTHVNDLWSRGLVDTFRYIGGELRTEDITDGTDINKWVEAARLSNGAGLHPRIGADEADKRIAAIAGVSVERMRALEQKLRARRPAANGKIDPSQRTPLERALIADLEKVARTKASLDGESFWAPIYEARMNVLRGTPAEAHVITPAMQQLAKSALGDVAKWTAGSAADPNQMMMRAASILQGMNPKLRQALENRFHNAIAERGACIMNFEALAPLGYAALSDELQAKFGKFNPQDDPFVQRERADRMKDWLRRRAHYAVIAHEMGHSFGLRHNFVSSSDAWNFRWQYWALRTNAKAVRTECPDDASAAADGRNCVGPRWLDKLTPNEIRNIIHMWTHSSTMEYAGEPSQDLLGLGAYDFGAARLFYGENVAVYADSRFQSNKPAGRMAQGHQNDFGGLLGFRYGSFANPTHYSHLDKEVNLIEKCETVDPEAFRPTYWDEEKDGIWSPLLDGHIVTTEDGKPVKCTQPQVDFVQWDAMKSTTDKTHTTDAKNRVRVPHGFASDNWADLGNVAVFRHDNGADLYETMHFWQAQQEMNHIFSSYRRGRRDFSVWGAFMRNLSRYHEKMRDSAKAIGLYVNLARDTVVNYNAQGEDPEAFVAEVLKQVAVESSIASSIAFDHFTHVFSRPQPGRHGTLGNENPGNGVTIARSWDGTGFAGTGNTAPLLQVANGVTGGFGTISLGGRPIENALDRTQGRDYNSEYTLNCGSYYEKAFTAYLMTESADNFISASRDDYVDPRFRAVSLADVFPDGFRRWLANNLTNDEQIKGRYAMAQGGNGTIGPPALDDAGYAVLGTTSWWPKEGVEVCFPKEDRLFCHDPFTAGTPAGAGGTVVDPQVGFEQQKFAIYFSLIFLPENARTQWTDMMRVYDVSKDGDPGFDNIIMFHDPNGKVYAAQTFGTEVLYGKTVQRGIAARMIEYANELLRQAVVAEEVTRNGRTVGWKPALDGAGRVQYRNAASCEASRYCQKMKDYTSLLKLMFELEEAFGWGRAMSGGLKGVY